MAAFRPWRDYLGMCHKAVGVAGFAVLDCFFRVIDRLGQMVSGEGEGRCK